MGKEGMEKKARSKKQGAESRSRKVAGSMKFKATDREKGFAPKASKVVPCEISPEPVQHLW